MTQRPDLFAAAVPGVGVLDMLRYHTFTIGWAWASDCGTSADSAEIFQYLRGNSPVHNTVKDTDYPATLVLTGDHDDQLQVHRRLAARPRRLRPGARPHRDVWRPRRRRVFSFLLFHLGATPKG